MSTATVTSALNPTLERLDDQIRWYEVRSSSNMRGYQAAQDLGNRLGRHDPSFAASGILQSVVVIGILVIGRGNCQNGNFES